MPGEADDFEDTPLETAPAPEKKVKPEEPDTTRFKSRYLRQAEELGIDLVDIQECETNAELLEMIRDERDRKVARREAAPVRETRKPPVEEPVAKPAEADEEWVIEADEEWIGEHVKGELKRLGKELLKAKKSSSQSERVEKLEKLVEAQQRVLEAQARRSHPLVRQGNAAVAKYPSLFGSEFDEDGCPPADSYERFRYDKLIRYLFGVAGDDRYPPHVNHDVSPAESVRKAVMKLFPDAAELKPAEDEAEEVAKPKAGSRVADWNKSAQAPPTNRNGADRTGIPDRTGKEAKKAARQVGLDDAEADDDDL